MKILQRMLLVNCLPVLMIALLFFVLVLQMVDLFGNLWRYLNQDVPLSTILEIQLLYIPKCISYAVPIALLFSVSYTLGQLYANNELIALLGSGVSLRYMVFPLLLLGFFLGLFMLGFDDRVVIPTFSQKNGIMRHVLGLREDRNNTNITIRGEAEGVIYSAEYYNDGNRTLSNVTVIVLDRQGRFQQRIDAKWADYTDNGWVFHNARIYSRHGKDISEEQKAVYTDSRFQDTPDSFRRRQKAIEELTLEEARIYLQELEKAGQESRVARTDYYKRIAFIFTPLIVSMISAAIGSRFKKNILLMSLLLSLSISVVFYVFQMVTGIFANIGILPPFAGSFLPVIVFFFLGIVMLQFVRT